MQIKASADAKLPQKPLHEYTIDDYLKMIVIFPNNDRIYYNLGLKYFEAGLVDSAIRSYEKALELNPHNQYAEQNLKIAQLVRTLQEG